MDSLTQIVLGAAVGEAVLGKKLGNRAMVWGALAGTIPDLDIIGNAFMDRVDALAFHRGISHSIFFAAVTGIISAWLLNKFYKKKFKHWIEFGIASIFLSFIFMALGFIFFKLAGPLSLIAIVPLYGFLIYRSWQDLVVDKENYLKPSLREWQWFWFLGLVTHPILDSFTQYGTQLFAPFSTYRVAFNNISVADPSYTFPFVLCLIIASLFWPKNVTIGGPELRMRKIWNWAGIIISSSYMIFTIYNKLQIDKTVVQSLEEMNIKDARFTASPTILNNVLWSATAELDSTYLIGKYSHFDTKPRFKFTPINKNHHLIADAKDDDRTINTLKWFSNDFYGCIDRGDGLIQFSDLRYGTFREGGEDQDDFIFYFMIKKGEDGYYHMQESQGGPPEGGEDEMLNALWSRIKGI